VKRQLELAGEYLEPGEVERLLEDKSEQIFYRHIMPETVAAQMALDDASNRHSELLKLERSIAELTECFKDIYELVHCQAGNFSF
jgi:t-SNARE complex subunit (syntaxin)